MYENIEVVMQWLSDWEITYKKNMGSNPGKQSREEFSLFAEMALQLTHNAHFGGVV